MNTKDLSKEAREKISNLQQAIWKLNDAADLIQDAKVTVLPEAIEMVIRNIETEIEDIYFQEGVG